ncbi:MAG TPA: TRAP transporter small permease subunit [Terriglobia bacterium]|jgi:TRAP-type C4-dicarboxylate transport system permease small subunit
MRRLLDFLYDAAGYLAAFFVFAIFAVMIGQTVMREIGLSTGGTDDLVAWFGAAAAFLAMAHAFRRGDFVRVVLLLQHLGPRARRLAEAASLAVAACFCGYLAFWVSRFVHESWQFHDMANGLIAIPLWIPQTSFVIGAILLFVAVLDEFVVVLRGGTPGYVTATEERRRRGDFTEDI